MDDSKDVLRNLGRRVKDGDITWKQAAIKYNELTGIDLNAENFRGRYRNLNDDYVPNTNKIDDELESEYETHYEDGSVELSKKLWFDKDVKKTPEMILQLFGYDENEWEVISWTFGKYEVAIKEEDTNRECITVRAKIKPKLKKELSIEDYANIAKDVFSSSIKSVKLPKQSKNKSLNEDKLLELTGIELHLGKLAFESVSGQDYNTSIANERFDKIIKEVAEQQDVERCGTCLVCIGNDFFNSDTVGNTTTKGTQQYNDVNWKVMFNIGLEMYVKMLLTLRSKFNNIEVRLQQGNHDYMSSFYLYTALQCYFRDDDIIKFSNDIKDVQVFEWGKCAIFFTHGDTNLKRLVKSIPAEFYDVWGRTIYRELHLGHLHSEIVIDDNSGLVTRRVGSPTGTDDWHYQERFIGATQKYQTFVWDKNNGLSNVKYITFDSPEKPKVLRLTK